MSIELIIKGIFDNQAKLKKQISEGDQKAKSVANFYDLVVKYPDSGSVSLLTSAYEEWCKENRIAA